jgi:subtilisin family serine protease
MCLTVSASGSPIQAALGPSLRSRAASGDDHVAVVILLENSRVSHATLTAAAGHPNAYRQTRTILHDQNESLVADFLAAANTSSIELGKVRTYWLAPFVSAVVATRDLARVEALPGVEAIIEDAPIQLIEPIESDATIGAAPAADATAASQNAVGVKAVWQRGITGKGVLVASIDTGVDGTHPSLANRYRGLTASASASWRDPEGGTFPNDARGHGTHTMGTVLGREGADTIGIAPDAQWIAAGVVDRSYTFAQTITDLVDAFEWLADPDGNPDTHSDVPDVVLNSWGIPQGILTVCDNTFWQVVDNLEALGTVVVFAAGNEGPNPATLRLPADRGDAPLKCFSVGAVDAADVNLRTPDFSSRGPVSCNSAIIKPEISAPGVNIRSAATGGGYQLRSGTSMAAPHAVGAIALMRHYNPDATPDEIKRALVESASDLGEPGPDCTTGYGLLNIERAIELLPAPMPTVWNWSVPVMSEPTDGEAELSFAPVEVVMNNLGRSFEGMSIELSALSSADILQNQTRFSFNFVASEVGSVSLPVSVQSSTNRERGDRIWLDAHITADHPRLDTTVHIGIPVGVAPQRAALAQTCGPLVGIATNFGRFDAYSATALSTSGAAFTFAGQTIPFAGGLRIVTAANDRSSFGDATAFEPAPNGILSIGLGSVLSQTSFRDTRTIDPIGIEFNQAVHAPDGGPGTYLLYAYEWQRLWTDVESQPLRLAAWFNWDLPGVESIFVPGSDGAIAVEKDGMWLGAVMLGTPAVRAAIPFDAGWAQLPAVPASDAIESSVAESFLLSLASELSSHDSGRFAVAILAAQSREEWESAARNAQTQYAALNSDGEPATPSVFELLPNYPNPFNPATTIRYSLEQDSHVRVELFNILGRKVRTLSDAFQTAGDYRITWDATSDAGVPLSSGVYFLRVTAGEHNLTRKLTLLR